MDAVVELPQETPLPSAKYSLPHAFTRENAAEMQLKSSKSHERRKKATLANSPENYIKARLRRVRAQLAKLDGLIDNELDPQKLDRLVCAQNRLSEQWRIFSGIPLPGSRRPGRETPAKRSGEVGPVE